MKKNLLKNKIEDALELMVSDYQEEEAAEKLLCSHYAIQNIEEMVEEGTPFRLAVRTVLNEMVEQLDQEERFEYDGTYDFEESYFKMFYHH